eukprot:7606819-Pyramimonas_sp.AAC.1
MRPRRSDRGAPLVLAPGRRTCLALRQGKRTPHRHWHSRAHRRCPSRARCPHRTPSLLPVLRGPRRLFP